MTLLVLLLFITIVPTVNRYDVIEHNTFCDEDGREVMQQWIAWDWASIDGVHRCQWWARASGEIPTRTADGWRVTVGGKRIEARAYRVTRTVGDPEVADRSVWPVENRRRVR